MSEFFSPLTFSYEWEILILKKDLSLANSREVIELSSEIRRQFRDVDTGVDFVRGAGKMLEIRPGILKSAEELSEITLRHLKLAKEECKKRKLYFLPCGSHPLTGFAIGLHVHAGSIYDMEKSRMIADILTKYAPCFLALSVNSPFGREKYGEFKSYRILNHADVCSLPRIITPAGLFHPMWGDDVCIKTDWHSTIELRIADSASSVNFLKEFVLFFVSFVYSLKPGDYREIDETVYTEYIINRWRAAKYGLQAVFLWDGNEIPVTELLEEMMDRASFEHIGAEKPVKLKKMIEKRKTQADWQMEIYRIVKDRYAYTQILAGILKHEDPFMDYIESTDALPAVEPEPMEEFVLSLIGKETPYRDLHEFLRIPFPLLDKFLEKFEKEGKVKIEVDPEKGKRISKI